MHGTVPTEEDEISYPIAGDAVDHKLYELIQAKYPKAQLTQNMCKTFKEQYGFVTDAKDKIEVMIPVDGKPTPHDITARDEAGLRDPDQPDRRGHPEARLQLQPGIPGEAAPQRAALRRRRPDATA